MIISEENIRKYKPRNQSEKIAEIRSYLFKEINKNELIKKKHKKICRVLTYIDQLLIRISTITG